MPLDERASVTIDRPPDVVARYAFDPGNDPGWIGGVKTVERQTPDPIAVGSRVLRRGSFMGRPLEWLMEVVELEPARKIAMHALRSPFPMDVTYELEPSGPSGGSTQATIRVQGEAGGYYAIAGPLLGPMVRRSLAADANRLKKLVEAGA